MTPSGRLHSYRDSIGSKRNLLIEDVDHTTDARGNEAAAGMAIPKTQGVEIEYSISTLFCVYCRDRPMRRGRPACRPWATARVAPTDYLDGCGYSEGCHNIILNELVYTAR